MPSGTWPGSAPTAATCSSIRRGATSVLPAAIPSARIGTMTSGQQNLPPPPPPEVYHYLVEELNPLKREVFPLWQKLLTLKITLWESFRRKQLREYQSTYDSFAARWVKAKEKVTILEKLISPDDKEGEEKLGVLLTSGYLQQMVAHESELARIMNDLSNTLRDKRTEADFKVAISLSTIAVILVLVSVIISVFLK
jgi:hypothetical protein